MKKIGLLALFILGCSTFASFAQEEEINVENKLRDPLPAKSDAASLKIIANYLKVKGGINRILSIQNRVSQAHISEGKSEYNYTLWEAPPCQFHQKKVVSKLGREYVTLTGFDGEVSWIYDLTQKHPFPKETSKADVKKFKRSYDFHGPFIDSESKGILFEYEGKVKSRKRDNYLVKLYYPNGLHEYYYFDAKNFMISRRGWKENIGGSIVNKDEFITSYTKINGVWIADTIELAIENQVFGKITIQKIEVNQPVEANLFSIPKVKEHWVKQK